ncbi:MAG TPA: bifunctional diguanylate cyclase/phosphodiesterase, partial [Rubellimicrobium sp.]|nr:bifunctional diguanylate cyclase/phosphodiesterase [Rubellimicrobium sp.]
GLRRTDAALALRAGVYNMRNLPARIAALMIWTVLVFVGSMTGFILWMTQALDHQARDHSLEQIGNARANLLAQARMITLDYAKWEASLAPIAAADVPWIYENIGLSAQTGQAFQMAVLWGGHLHGDVGWIDDGQTQGRSGLLDPHVLGQVEAGLRRIPLQAYDGVQFFTWDDGTLYVLAASRVESGSGVPGPEVQDSDTARIALGVRLTNETIDRIGQDYLLSNLDVDRVPMPERASLPLLGADGQPVAYLAWDTPQPGTAMLHDLLPWLVAVVLVASASALLGVVLVRRSAVHLVVAEAQASTAARTDALTGLPNRAAFNDAQAGPAAPGERAVLFLDVNGFKRINDSIGHAAGDLVIVQVARRLARRGGPQTFLARIAGDEFVYVVSGQEAQERTEDLACQVQEALDEPFLVLGHQMRLGMAMGYAVQSDDSMTGDDLVRQADLAMYEAKRHERQGLVGFTSVIEQASRDAAIIEQGLRQALERPGELSIAYQPIVAADGRLARAEALARWTSPDLGSVPPDRFIAVAEQAGLIVELGRRLFHLICDDLRRLPTLEVSINISPLQLMAPDFIPSIVEELARWGVAPTRIEIELTEAVVVDDTRLAALRLEELHQAGFTTALDDFGTGYSSIGYLRQMGFDTLKIDRSFVSEIRRSAEGIAVVNGMITMAHGLGLRVVCEGIETAEELELLRGLGCDLAQGFHLDRPLPIMLLAERWLGTHEERVAVA